MADDKTHHPIDGLAALVADMATDIRRRAVEEPWFGKPLDGPVGEQSQLAGWGQPGDTSERSEWDPNALSPFSQTADHWTGADDTPPIEHDPLLRPEGPREEPPPEHDHGISP